MSTIDNLLAVAQRRLAEIDGEAEHLRALIRLYAGAAQGNNIKQAGPDPDAKGRSRGVSPSWKPLGEYLVMRGELHLNDLEAYSIQNTLGFERTQIRNQMHNWKRSGFVQSPRQSVFAITPAGVAEMTGDKSPNSNGADHEPAPPPDLENRDEPQSPGSARFDLLNVHKAPTPGGGT